MFTFLNTLHIEKKKEEKLYRSIKVVAVVDDLSTFHASLQGIKEFCLEQRIMYTTRVYNSSKIWEDCDIILRLPAIHVYINKGYNRTFYPNTRPFQHIEECIDLHDARIIRNKQRRRFWSSLYSNMGRYLQTMFRKKSKMERRNEEEAAQATKQIKKQMLNLEVERHNHLRQIEQWS